MVLSYNVSPVYIKGNKTGMRGRNGRVGMGVERVGVGEGVKRVGAGVGVGRVGAGVAWGLGGWRYLTIVWLGVQVEMHN